MPIRNCGSFAFTASAVNRPATRIIRRLACFVFENKSLIISSLSNSQASATACRRIVTVVVVSSHYTDSQFIPYHICKQQFSIMFYKKHKQPRCRATGAEHKKIGHPGQPGYPTHSMHRNGLCMQPNIASECRALHRPVVDQCVSGFPRRRDIPINPTKAELSKTRDAGSGTADGATLIPYTPLGIVPGVPSTPPTMAK